MLSATCKKLLLIVSLKQKNKIVKYGIIRV